METKDIKILQKKILEIAVDFDFFCRENNIIYYLMGGSALGAMRHRGFIPWDDDFDVFMTYDNYNRFLKCAEANLDKQKYYLQKENTKEWPSYFSKVRMNNTAFIEENLKDRTMHHGIYIDIFCLHNTSKYLFPRRIQYVCARMLATKATVNLGYKTKSKTKKIYMFVARVIVCGPFKKILQYILKSKNKKNTKYVGHFMGRAKFKNTSFTKDTLGKPRYVAFENVMLPVPEKVEEYLTIRYGDFMAMPSEETKSKYPAHACLWDVDKSYESYINYERK